VLFDAGSEASREPGTTMKSTGKPHDEFVELADEVPEVAAVKAMSVADLVTKYREVFGEPTHSRNRRHLVRSICWRIQELAYGGISAAAIAKMSIVSQQAPRPWRRRLLDQGVQPVPVVAQTPPARPVPSRPRDPRLPPIGTVLRREYRHAVHEVIVLRDGFEYRGKQYASLSRIAQEITGTTWNGYGFFRIPTKAADSAEVSA
jgi:hypothetical protein